MIQTREFKDILGTSAADQLNLFLLANPTWKLSQVDIKYFIIYDPAIAKITSSILLTFDA